MSQLRRRGPRLVGMPLPRVIDYLERADPSPDEPRNDDGLTFFQVSAQRLTALMLEDAALATQEQRIVSERTLLERQLNDLKTAVRVFGETLS